MSNRKVLYTYDIRMITGRCERTARNMSTVIKRKNGVPFVTVKTFCEYSGVEEEVVLEYLARTYG